MNKLMQKCHSIIVTGKVQDIGFRSIVEHIGRSFGIPGLVFNAKDGSVKILCSCEDNVIDNFTKAIKVRGAQNGTEIVNIKEQTLSINIDLPDEFSKVSSDDEIDLGRKFDKANVLLSTMIVDNKSGFNEIKGGFNEIKGGFNEIKGGLNEIKGGLNEIKIGINNMTTIMLEQNKRMDEHNTRLEAILEKLVER
ncbi:MAG: acylphosphatase [Euryarchaeota archaeon]|nr:acylphosphatase [Euryarchaeota archaeon]